MIAQTLKQGSYLGASFGIVRTLQDRSTDGVTKRTQPATNGGMKIHRLDKLAAFDSLRPLPVAVVLAGANVILAVIAPLFVSISFLGVQGGVLVGLMLATFRSSQTNARLPFQIQTLMNVSRDQEIAAAHDAFAAGLEQISGQRDPLYRRLALERLNAMADRCAVIGNKTIEFTSTESWRVVYEELLRCPGLQLYRSVAHIESAHYWQDGPGQRSTRLNLELHDACAISIERTAIIADHLWPQSSPFPIEPLHQWLEEQHCHGIWIRLVRESALIKEPELISDFGIYGNRAVGMQIADPAGRTIRFVLSFDFTKVLQSESHWNRLAIYAISYKELLDQQGGSF